MNTPTSAFRTAAFAALTLAVAFAPPVLPCTAPCTPGTASNAFVLMSEAESLPGNLWQVPIRINGYKTAGGDPGEYCTCSLGGVFSGVKDIVEFGIYYAGTETLIPGFDTFATNAQATIEWKALNGNTGDWQGFLAPVFSTIPSGTLVDLQFEAIVKIFDPTNTTEFGTSGQASQITNEGCIGDNCPDRVPSAEILAILQEELATATIGTDAATASGNLLDMHQELTSIGSVTIQEDMAFSFLGGGIAGTNGEVSLTGSGQLGPGDSGALHLTSAIPSDNAFLVVGIAELGAPLKGGTLVPSPDIVINLITGTDGAFTLPFTDVPDFGLAFDVYAQVWQPDRSAVKNFAASNGLALHVN